jgi:hypothetical protein
MLFLQILLFFLFSILAFARPVSDTSSDSDSEGSSAQHAIIRPPWIDYSSSISVIAHRSVYSHWYCDIQDEDKQIHLVMQVIGKPKGKNIARIILGPMSPEVAWKEMLTLRALSSSTYMDAVGEWNRYPNVSANLL